MTKFDLVLELLYTMNEILDAGISTPVLLKAQGMLDYSIDRFEEFDGDTNPPKCRMEVILDGIDSKIRKMPPALRDYFQFIEHCQAENEIRLCCLPHEFSDQTMEQVQFMIEFYDIFNEMLEMGMTSCNVHHAHMRINKLFQDFYESEDGDLCTCDHLTPYFGSVLIELDGIIASISNEWVNDDDF